MKRLTLRVLSVRTICLMVPVLLLGSMAVGCHHEYDHRDGYRDYHDHHDDHDFDHDHDHQY